MEHVLLVDFDAGLVEGVHLIEVAAHRARPHEVIHKLAKGRGGQTVKGDQDIGDASGLGVGLNGAHHGFLLDKVHGLAVEVIQAVEVVIVMGDVNVIGGLGDA